MNSLTFQDNQAETSLYECIPEFLPKITPRQNEIENLLIEAYATVVVNDWASQRDHDCLMLDDDIRVYQYLTQALEKTKDDSVMRVFSMLAETLDPALNSLERLR